MDIIQQSLMQWGEAMQLTMENRSLFYSPVLNHWRVKKWAGKDARKFIFEGEDFLEAFEIFLGSAINYLPTADQNTKKDE